MRAHLAPFYSPTARPSIEPDLMIRMLRAGYCPAICSERRLFEGVHLNLAYRWFCRLGLGSDAPDHTTFSKNRHGRSRDSDLLRELFDSVVPRRMAEDLVGGPGGPVSFAYAGERLPRPGRREPAGAGGGRAVAHSLKTSTRPPSGRGSDPARSL